jgi:hypothetical protein
VAVFLKRAGPAHKIFWPTTTHFILQFEPHFRLQLQPTKPILDLYFQHNNNKPYSHVHNCVQVFL